MTTATLEAIFTCSWQCIMRFRVQLL